MPDLQGRAKVGTVQDPVTVPTLDLWTVVTFRVVGECQRSKVVLIYPTKPATNTTP